MWPQCLFVCLFVFLYVGCQGMSSGSISLCDQRLLQFCFVMLRLWLCPLLLLGNPPSNHREAFYETYSLTSVYLDTPGPAPIRMSDLAGYGSYILKHSKFSKVYVNVIFYSSLLCWWQIVSKPEMEWNRNLTTLFLFCYFVTNLCLKTEMKWNRNVTILFIVAGATRPCNSIFCEKLYLFI